MCGRSLFVVAWLAVTLATAQASPSVGVDLTKLEAAFDAAELEQALVIRLLQEGFAIDPLTGAPAIVVAIAGGDRELVLSAKSAHFAESRTIDVGDSSGAQLHLELVQKTVELARLAREAVPPTPPAPMPPTTVAAAQVREPAVEVERAVVAAPRAPRWQLGFDVGVVSSRAVETALFARFAIAHGFGAVLHGSTVGRDAAEISVGEQDILAGASYQWPFASVLALDIGVLAGVRRHHFVLAQPLEERTGTRFDAALAVPLRLSLRPSRVFEVSVWGVAKLARPRAHVDGDTELWHRDAAGAGVGAGVAARF